MIQFHVYPGGKKRIVTFSYDDGSQNDARLIALFNRYGVKATFHLIGGKYKTADTKTAAELRTLYTGHEVACHTLSHGWPARMPAASLVTEIMEDRKILEKIFARPILGMSYPCGVCDKDVTSILAACGILYSRTTRATDRFRLPDAFLLWDPTCHHRDAQKLAEKFMDTLDSEWTSPLFYIWGHSHELKTEEDWAYMEALLKTLSKSDKIWYATNMEIYSYFTAQQHLQISADETIFYNPSDIPVWVERDKKEILEIPAGKTVIFAKE